MENFGSRYHIPSIDWDGKEVEHSEKINEVINFIDGKDLS